MTTGQYYRFDIYASTDVFNNPTWEFCVKNVTQGEAYHCHSISRTWGTIGGNLAWWGFEDHYTTSTLGPPANLPRANMHYMQWLTNQSGAPWMIEDYTSCLNQSNPGQYSWYHCGVTTSVYPADTLNAWTGNH